MWCRPAVFLAVTLGTAKLCTLICQTAWGTAITGGSKAALKGISTHASTAWGPSLVTLFWACTVPLGRPHFMGMADNLRLRQQAHALKVTR